MSYDMEEISLIPDSLYQYDVFELSCWGASVDCVRYVTARKLEFQTPNTHVKVLDSVAGKNLRSANPFHTDSWQILLVCYSLRFPHLWWLGLPFLP